MATVILVSKTGQEFPVSTVYAFVNAIYGNGASPKTGTVRENYEALQGGTAPSGPSDPLIRMSDVQNPTSPFSLAQREAFEARIPREGATDGAVVMLRPGGELGFGTVSSYDGGMVA